jgi:hypothetical protein
MRALVLIATNKHAGQPELSWESLLGNTVLLVHNPVLDEGESKVKDRVKDI